MKKIFALICAGIIGFSISACSGSSTVSDDVKVKTESSVETTNETDTGEAVQEAETETEQTNE